MKARRAVVTGLGVVSPVGIGADVAWDALVAGQSGIDDITLFDAGIIGEGSTFEKPIAPERGIASVGLRGKSCNERRKPCAPWGRRAPEVPDSTSPRRWTSSTGLGWWSQDLYGRAPGSDDITR